MKLSVLIPVYNEARTIGEVIRQVLAVPVEKEVLIVDDGSTDGTREALKEWDGRDGVRVILHDRNLGKGRALATAIQEAAGDVGPLIVPALDPNKLAEDERKEADA